MDITVLSFYAVVCGVLSIVAPSLGTTLVRFAIGAGVGVVAALLLPSVRALIGI